MPKIGEILRRNQPKEYKKLRAMFKNQKDKSNEKLSWREIEDLMRHDGYRRDGGVIRQVRHGR